MGTNGYTDSGELEDEAVARPKEATMIFEDGRNPSTLLLSLNMMRKNVKFCDLLLHVENVTIPAHKAVLCAASPHFLEIFVDDRTPIIDYKLNFDKNSVEKIIDYVYTSRIELNGYEVRSVFTAASFLKLDRLTQECGVYLVNNLNSDTCIEIRNLPDISKDKEFLLKIDSFIKSNFEEISQKSSFLALPCIKVEILSPKNVLTSESISRLVLDYFGKNQVPDWIEKTHLLYLALDNTLKDCVDLSGFMGDSQIVQDYKKISKNMKKSKSVALAKPRVILYSDVNFADDIIASRVVSEGAYLSLVSYDSRLYSLSILLRANPSEEEEMDVEEGQETPTYCTLASMNSVKCAAGCANLNERLLVCGGYDRGECLRTTQIYLPITNEWKDLSPMLEPRGRFNIAVVDGLAYAIGGCNGTNELSAVEIYREPDNKWEKISSLPLPRSHTAISSLNGLIYCIGGFNDQIGIKQCDLFNPKDKTWSQLAPMLTGRYQAAACGFQNKIWVVGGCDGWSCLGSVEVYDPETNTWASAEPLITPRRGPGLQVFQGKLYCVGGWDGSHSLSSTEIYDPTTKCWSPGPSMTTMRSNLGLAVAGSKLYAIGGFSNKTFLNSIEVLSAGEEQEWTTFCLKTQTDQNQN